MEKYTVVFFTSDGKSIFHDGDIAHTFTETKDLWDYVKRAIEEIKEATSFKIFRPDDPVVTAEYWDIDRDWQRA